MIEHTILSSKFRQARAENLIEEAQEILDDAIHSLFERAASPNAPCPFEDEEAYEAHMDAASHDASDLNNSGWDAQIRHIVDAGAAQCVMDKLDDILST